MKTKKQRKRNPKQKPTKSKKQRDQIETQNTKTKNRERGTQKPMKTKNREIWACCFCWRSEVVGLLKIVWDLGLWDLQKTKRFGFVVFVEDQKAWVCWRSCGIFIVAWVSAVLVSIWNSSVKHSISNWNLTPTDWISKSKIDCKGLDLLDC